jgi:plastocyanin
MAKPGFWLICAAWSALAAASAFAAKEVVVEQKDLGFRPNKIELSVGDTVVFTNEDKGLA